MTLLSASAWPTSATTTPIDSRAASSSASRSPGPSRCSPKLLLLDEITSALDPELVAEVLNVVRELADGGMTMVLATHEMGFAREVAEPGLFPRRPARSSSRARPTQMFSSPREERTRRSCSGSSKPAVWEAETATRQSYQPPSDRHLRRLLPLLWKFATIARCVPGSFAMRAVLASPPLLPTSASSTILLAEATPPSLLRTPSVAGLSPTAPPHNQSPYSIHPPTTPHSLLTPPFSIFARDDPPSHPPHPSPPPSPAQTAVRRLRPRSPRPGGRWRRSGPGWLEGYGRRFARAGGPARTG